MIFALGNVSGAHFNPAVTVSILLAGRGKCSPLEGGVFVLSQLVGGVCGAMTYSLMHHGNSFALEPVKPHGWPQALVGEAVFTFILCFVVLSVATVRQPLSQFFGLVIGSCVTAGGFAIGGISGGSLNPAVSFGISSAHILNGGTFWSCLIYSIIELFAGVAAVGAFIWTQPSEYTGQEKASLVGYGSTEA